MVNGNEDCFQKRGRSGAGGVYIYISIFAVLNEFSPWRKPQELTHPVGGRCVFWYGNAWTMRRCDFVWAFWNSMILHVHLQSLGGFGKYDFQYCCQYSMCCRCHTLKLSRSEIMDLFHLSEFSKPFAEHCPVAVGSPVPAKNWLSATVVVFPAFVLFVPFEAWLQSVSGF